METLQVTISRPSLSQPWGMNLVKDKQDRGTVIQYIKPNSPVLQSVLQKEDIITKVNNSEIAHLSIEQVQKLFATNLQLQLQVMRLNPSSSTVNTGSTTATATTTTTNTASNPASNSNSSSSNIANSSLSAPPPTITMPVKPTLPQSSTPASIPNPPTTEVNINASHGTANVAANVNRNVNTQAVATPAPTSNISPRPNPSATRNQAEVIDLISDDEEERTPELSPRGTGLDSDGRMSEDSDSNDNDGDDDNDWVRDVRSVNAFMRNISRNISRPSSTNNRGTIIATRLVTPNSGPVVIDLLSDDDEPAPAPPRPSPRPALPTAQPARPTQSLQIQPLLSSAQAPAPNAPATVTQPLSAPAVPSTEQKTRMMGRIKVKLEHEPKKFGEANIGDEVIEVEDPNKEQEDQSELGKKRSRLDAFGDDDGDDIEIVGGNMVTAADMPHQREACTRFPFKYHYGKNLSINESYCSNCYCYVCEVKASECMDWKEHCCANYKEPKWKKLRDSTNTAILKLMSPAQKAAFLGKYGQLFGGGNSNNRASSYDSDYYDDEDEDDFGYHLNYLFGGYNSHGGGGEHSSRIMNDCIEAAKKLLNKEYSMNADEFLECSGLIVQMISLKTSFKYETLHGLIIDWVLHPMCKNELREVLKKELHKTNMNIHISFTKIIDFLPGFLADPNRMKDRIPQELLRLPEQTIASLILRIAPIADYNLLQIILAGSRQTPASKGKLLYTLAQCNYGSCDGLLSSHLNPNSEEAFLMTSVEDIPTVAVTKVLGMMLDINFQRAPITYISQNTIYRMIQKVLFKLKSISVDTWFSLMNDLPQNRFLQSYFELPRATFQYWIIQEVLSVADEQVKQRNMLEIFITMFILQTYKILYEPFSCLSASQIERLNIFIGGNGAVVSWAMGNICVSWAALKRNVYTDVQQDLNIHASVVLLKEFLNHVMDSVCDLHGNPIVEANAVEVGKMFTYLHVCLKEELQRLPIFLKYVDLPHIPSSQQTKSVGIISPSEPLSTSVEYALARLADMPPAQNQRRRYHLYISDKASAIRYFYTDVDDTKRALRFSVIGDFLSPIQVITVLKLIHKLWELFSAKDSINNSNIPTSKKFSLFMKENFFLFRIVWKGLYFNVQEGNLALNAPNSARSKFIEFMQNYKPFCDWKEVQPVSDEDPDLLVFQVLFLHCLSIWSLPGIMSKLSANFLPTIAMIKEHILALPRLLVGVDPALGLIHRAQIWYLGNVDKSSPTSSQPESVAIVDKDQEFFWKEFKKSVLVLANVEIQSTQDRLFMSLLMEDWQTFEYTLTSAHTPLAKLAKIPYASLQWTSAQWAENRPNLVSVLSEYLKNSHSPEFRLYPEPNIWSKLVLDNPDSVLTHLSLHFSHEFVGTYVTNPIPAMHWIAAQYRNSSDFHIRAVYVKALDYVKKATKLTYPPWAKYCLFLCFSFLDLYRSPGGNTLVEQIVTSDFDNTMNKLQQSTQYQQQHQLQQGEMQGIHSFFSQLFLDVDEELVASNIQAFLTPIFKMYQLADTEKKMELVIKRLEEILEKKKTTMTIVESSRYENDKAHIYAYRFIHYYNEQSYVTLAPYLQNNPYLKENIEAFILKYYPKSARYNVRIQVKILYHVLGSNSFISHLLTALDEGTAMLETVVELVPNINIRQGEVIMWLVNAFLKLPQLTNELKENLRKNISQSWLLSYIHANPNSFRLESMEPMTLYPVDLANEYNSNLITEGFAINFLLCLLSPSSVYIQHYLKLLGNYSYYHSVKLRVFHFLTNPKDNLFSLKLLVENRIYQAIPTFIMGLVERTATRTEIKTLTECLVTLSSLLQVELLLPYTSAQDSTADHSMGQDVRMFNVWLNQKEDSLLRSLYSCLFPLQLQYFAVKDPKQQHPDSPALKTIIDNITQKLIKLICPACPDVASSLILTTVSKEQRLLILYVKCMFDYHSHVKDFIAMFVEMDAIKHQIELRKQSEVLTSDRPMVATDNLVWNELLTEITSSYGTAANFYALLKISRLLIEIKKRKHLDYLVEVFSSDNLFYRHILGVYVTPCTVWIGNHHQEKHVEGGLVQASRTLPSINESMIKYLNDTIGKLGKLAARSFELVAIMMLLGYNPLDLNVVQDAYTPTDALAMKGWMEFARLILTTLENKSMIMKSIVSLQEVSRSPNLISNIIEEIPHFLNDPAFPAWSAFFLHTLQNRIRVGLSEALQLFIFQQTFNPPIFPQQKIDQLLESASNNFFEKIDIIDEKSALALIQHPKVIDIIFFQHFNIENGSSNYIVDTIPARESFLEQLCKLNPDGPMAKRIGKLVEMIGNYAKTNTINASKREQIRYAIDALHRCVKCFHGDNLEYIRTIKAGVIKWVKSKKPVADIISTL